MQTQRLRRRNVACVRSRSWTASRLPGASGSFLGSRGFGYGVTRLTIERCWAQCNGDSDTSDEDEVALAIDDF